MPPGNGRYQSSGHVLLKITTTVWINRRRSRWWPLWRVRTTQAPNGTLAARTLCNSRSSHILAREELVFAVDNARSCASRPLTAAQTRRPAYPSHVCPRCGALSDDQWRSKGGASRQLREGLHTLAQHAHTGETVWVRRRGTCPRRQAPATRRLTGDESYPRPRPDAMPMAPTGRIFQWGVCTCICSTRHVAF
jgi:hypothetical protein